MTKLQVKQLLNRLDGMTLLECRGNLYEYIGMEGDKYIFQDVTDDSYIKTSYNDLLTKECYSVYETRR